MNKKSKVINIYCVLIVLLHQLRFHFVTMRPSTLNIGKQQKHDESRNFIREAFHAWKSRSRINVVPEDKIQELFLELKLHPSKEQVHDMLQTAKLFARRCNSFDTKSKYWNGLTLGEFCVLASDIRKFRTISILGNQNHDNSSENALFTFPSQTNGTDVSDSKSSPELSKKQQMPAETNGPEVFLGGSCNPTTWRADVAIPALDKLGISFYNPQVSQWTPDLIELEHRAKEKAKVLFFVMDSETRASAGAIETAHIAGENLKHLVLVLHPYRQNQTILNETISMEEFLDLSRNQILLEQLVKRRGLPVLNNIPSALQQIKGILSGSSCRDPPLNVASRLISLRRSYDRVVGNSEYGLTIAQCQQALSTLGYPSTIISSDNLNRILISIKEVFHTPVSPMTASNGFTEPQLTFISFEKFCLIDSYLSVLQQEINENTCVSPIKGTNLPPPPIFLTNTPEWTHNRTHTPLTPTPKSPTPSADNHHNHPHHHHHHNNSYAKQHHSNVICRSHTIENCKSLSDDRHLPMICKNHSYQISQNGSRGSIICSGSDHHLSRDSGTSSPQPNDIKSLNNLNNTVDTNNKTKNHKDSVEVLRVEEGEDSDSNDSVFSTGSSLNGDEEEEDFERVEMRDIYLGGSCMLRTRWRQNIAIPYLKAKNVSFHLPTLHESLVKLIKLNQTDEQTAFDDNRPDNETLLYNPAVLDSSRVLLFIITNETRSLAPMTLAAHYIGLGYNVVLCVQMLPEYCVIGNDELTSSAVKDYNRGRAYLIDLAKRQGIPVFKEIEPALSCAIDKVKVCKSRNSV